VLVAEAAAAGGVVVVVGTPSVSADAAIVEWLNTVQSASIFGNLGNKTEQKIG
jgi:hypothetical protein